MREQLTLRTAASPPAPPRPYASDAFAYLEPLRGGAARQLLLQRLSDHQLTPLTDGSHRDGAPLWAHDGKRLAFASNRRNGGDVDIYVLDTADAGAAPRLVAGGEGHHWRVYDWSIDDKRLLLGRELPAGMRGGTGGGAGGGADSEIYIAQVDSGEFSPVGFSAATEGGGERTAAASARRRAASQSPRSAAATRYSPPMAAACCC